MGTDIHLYVERLESQYNPDGTEADPTWSLMMHESCAYGQRNYDVFAVLADVRNGSGFAGCKTGDGFNVIAKPRGFPRDMSPEMRRHAEQLEHTPSWLLLSEVLAFDWKQTVTKEGVVGPAEFVAWKKNGRPREWSGGISGSEIRHVSNAAMEDMVVSRLGKAVSEIELPPMVGTSFDDGLIIGNKAYTSVRWQETYEEACEDFLKWSRALVQKCGYLYEGELLAGYQLKERGAWGKGTWQEAGPFSYEKPEHIRFVFWFDS